MIATTELAAEQFHAERRKRIGASDVPVLMGLSPHKTRHELFLEKTNRIEPDKGSDAAHLGNRFEAGVLDEAEEQLGPLERDVRLYHEGLDFPLAATLDARVLATGEPVQAKTSGLAGPIYGQWGEQG